MVASPYLIQANVQPAKAEFSLLSSLTGFTSTDVIDSISGTAAAAGLITGTGTFDFSGASGLQNVAAGDIAEFRIYVHNSGANPMTRIGIGQAFGTNGTADLTLNGTINAAAVPEPSLLALLGCMGLFAIEVRRRKAAAASRAH
ncbi:hypothetical protein Pla22_31900 [Rubripirellula amarantea]|uniref:PEP-CTERM protein-sorting domain-containing protein n=1 Tax=Rubripirellula amarantea TaxID=2527999 RepID=A0A5C5WIP7_9BACT|nr:hypothetical protein [Rubripirellula amarantea]TWT50447.1 hypothetical protein Pla22_31900 [Rubripirellula amarantea]